MTKRDDAGRLSQSLLDRAMKIAEEQAKVQGQLTRAFVERYGITYSDVDADHIIDRLDYGKGGDHLTVKACDRIMTELGHPPLNGKALGNEDDL